MGVETTSLSGWMRVAAGSSLDDTKLTARSSLGGENTASCSDLGSISSAAGSSAAVPVSSVSGIGLPAGPAGGEGIAGRFPMDCGVEATNASALGSMGVAGASVLAK